MILIQFFFGLPLPHFLFSYFIPIFSTLTSLFLLPTCPHNISINAHLFLPGYVRRFLEINIEDKIEELPFLYLFLIPSNPVTQHVRLNILISKTLIFVFFFIERATFRIHTSLLA